MYKLKKLELLGFKSFANRSRLEFADGVAAVVGPNGCGKSNISDAITWVLGEQSARSLRGERMSDVIFNGTGNRPPTGMAEVSMTLVNPEYNEAGMPEEAEITQESEPAAEGPAGFQPETPGNENGHGNGNGNGNGADAKPSKIHHRSGEITVTRRLFRSGESEYLINGDVCRLRDIQDLFMGTGLGPESYAIIEQGRIGQILSSRPADRRLMLEEAAGISKFKTRKRLAEAKLESSRQNLSRIADILEEVTKQVGSLKRQASKARRYRELHDELRSRLKTVLTSRLKALEVEFQRLRAELAQVQETCLRRPGNWKRWSTSRKAPLTGTKFWKINSPNAASFWRRAVWSANACSHAWSKSSNRPETWRRARRKPGAKVPNSRRSSPLSNSRQSSVPNRRRNYSRNLPRPRTRWPRWSCARRT